jgi:hypothetical protein
METIEQITKDTCVEKVKAMRGGYIDEFHEHCRSCTEQCDHYKPISRAQFNIKQGVYAMYNFWYHNISIRGMPTE